MPFELGHTHSQGKRPKVVFDTIVRAVKSDPEKLRQAIDAQLLAASNGDLDALDWLACRLEGKPAQAVTVSGDDERPLVSVIKTLIVYPDNSNGINSLRTVEGETVKENSLSGSVEQEGVPTLPHAVISAEGGGGEVGTIPLSTNQKFEDSILPATNLEFGNQDK